MKLLPVLVFILLSFNSAAQVTDADIKARIDKSLDKKLHKNTLRSFSRGLLLPPAMEQEGAPDLKNETRKPGVYALPDGGMPCLVPDQNAIVAIPNAAKIITLPFQGTMPNAYGGKNSKLPQPYLGIDPLTK